MKSKDIIAKAHDWIGTKFKHQGRIKKTVNDSGGCDCLGLIMGLEIKTKNNLSLNLYDQTNYPKFTSSNILLDKLNLLLEPIKLDDIKAGNIILIKINNWPQHLAIIVDVEPEITIIHSYAQARRVVKQYLPKEWKSNIVGVYQV